MFTPISDDGYYRIAKQLYAKDLEEDIIEFFQEHPNPSDEELHEWAEEQGYDPHKVEEIIYSMATEHIQKHLDNEDSEYYDEEDEDEDEEDDDKLEGGLADDKEPEDYDLEQILKGLKTEFEHTDDPELALEIAMDHLEEMDDYYDELSEMEEEE